MSDSYWNRPSDIRSLPQHVRDQLKQAAPLRDGEVHATITMHNARFKGTTMPTGRVWVEPYTEDREPHRDGVMITMYDPAGHSLVMAARMALPKTLVFIKTLLKAYVRQGGSVEDLNDVFTDSSSDGESFRG